MTGELCSTCGAHCPRRPESGETYFECPICNGRGCGQCVEGQIALDECPQSYIGTEMIEAVNMAAMCGKGDWPVVGGLLDQSAWFVALKRELDGELNRIEQDQMEAARNRR